MPRRTGRYEKFWSQFDTVAAASNNTLAVWPPSAYEDWDIAPEFVYENGWVLMRAEKNADAAVHNHLGTRQVPDPDGGPVARVPIRDAMPDVMGRLKAYDGSATPNHLVSICADVNMCPADEPYPLPAGTEPWPPLVQGEGGNDVSIRVIDTGRVRDLEQFGWMGEGVSGSPNLGVDYKKGTIGIYAGHGTFIAGLIKSIAPQAIVNVTNEMFVAGTAFEYDLGTALSGALAARPDIISLSAGSSTLNRRELLGLAGFRRELQENNHTLLVAAAGNEGAVQALMPAALGPASDGAILSVGALRADCDGLACFSNWGPEVQVYAPGERLVNAFAAGEYTYKDPPALHCRYHDPSLYCPCTCVTAPPQGARVHFEGMARWSGTSFATPIVAGLVASHMTKANLPPRDAARNLLQDRGLMFELPRAHPPLPQREGLALVPVSMRSPSSSG
jgi:subtilisin family serine protease